jgi:hypothetical protein
MNAVETAHQLRVVGPTVRAGGPRIRYMGTKHSLASEVASHVRGLPPGPLLDLFGGMGSIAGALAPHRPAYVNDVQAYASLAAT